MNRLSALAACFTALGLAAASPQPALPAAKDQSRIPSGANGGAPAPKHGQAGRERDHTTPSDSVAMPGGQTVELTTDSARRALDAFAEVRQNYADEDMQNYDSLEAFVRETEAGKRLEAEIQAHGFADVGDWGATIMAIGFAYDAMVESDQSDIERQIEALSDDRSLDLSLRRALIASLRALLPSANNMRVLHELAEDPIYRDKLKAFEAEE